MIVKYLISGGTAAFVDLGLLYVFTDIFHIWYVLSAAIAFIGAFGVSFTLQKFWTFRDLSKEGIHRQAGLYFLVAIINLGINTGLMYVFVDTFLLHYITAQIVAGALIAGESFLVYRYVIFKK